MASLTLLLSDRNGNTRTLCKVPVAASRSLRIARDYVSLWASRLWGMEGRGWQFGVNANGMPIADALSSPERITWGR
jgi:hypothetical protein